MNLQLLFPIPVAFFDLGFELNKKERTFLASQKRRPNQGNEVSVDNYILKKSAISRISNRLQKIVQEYSSEVWKSESEPFITQSWLNWTKPGEFHHRHAHPNSLYSGVFYVDVENTRDRIAFHQTGFTQIKPKYTEWNRWNSEMWWFPVKTNQVVIFPSSLEHAVQIVQGEAKDKERVSLAFNTFAHEIGSNTDLTELIV